MFISKAIFICLLCDAYGIVPQPGVPIQWMYSPHTKIFRIPSRYFFNWVLFFCASSVFLFILILNTKLVQQMVPDIRNLYRISISVHEEFVIPPLIFDKWNSVFLDHLQLTSSIKWEQQLTFDPYKIKPNVTF